jgi:hypothetical protein
MSCHYKKKIDIPRGEGEEEKLFTRGAAFWSSEGLSEAIGLSTGLTVIPCRESNSCTVREVI